MWVSSSQCPFDRARLKDSCGVSNLACLVAGIMKLGGEGLRSLFSGRGRWGFGLDPSQLSEPYFLIQEMGILQVTLTQKFT